MAFCSAIVMVGNVQAQQQSSQSLVQRTVARVDSSKVREDASVAAAREQAHDSNSVNTGQRVQLNVPGCNGPVSYCNLYIGG
jgi:hypothetical protein